MSKSLLSEIDEYLAESGLSGSRFGLLAANNSRLYERLKNGGRVWPETEALVRVFLRRKAAERRVAERRAS
jgi:hypothetical protein